LKVNLISQRAQSFLEKPEFYKLDLKSHLQKNFAVTLDENDRILTVFHRKNERAIETILAEVVSKFAKNKKISELWKINFREVDSFLRDSNHLPTFSDDQVLAEKLLQETKISLIAEAVGARLQNDISELKMQISQWSELGLVAKNLWAQKIIAPLEWELVLCETDSLVLTKTPEGVSPTEQLAVLQEVLGWQEASLPMKIVAV
jgi:hypothetical protein